MLKHYRLTVVILIALILCSCGKKDTDSISGNNSEVTETTQTTYATEMDMVQTDNYIVHSFGQYFGANIMGDTVQVYPHYMYDKYIKLETVELSTNNFWYDFITSKGYKMSDITMVESGGQILNTPDGIYGFMTLNSNLGLLAYTTTLPVDYMRMVLNHIE